MTVMFCFLSGGPAVLSCAVLFAVTAFHCFVCADADGSETLDCLLPDLSVKYDD